MAESYLEKAILQPSRVVTLAILQPLRMAMLQLKMKVSTL
jgi:hypothetical protein